MCKGASCFRRLELSYVEGIAELVVDLNKVVWSFTFNTNLYVAGVPFTSRDVNNNKHFCQGHRDFRTNHPDLASGALTIAPILMKCFVTKVGSL